MGSPPPPNDRTLEAAVDRMRAVLRPDAERIVVACRRPLAFAATFVASVLAERRAVLPANLQGGRLDEYGTEPNVQLVTDADVPDLPERPGAIVAPMPLPDVDPRRVIAEVFTSGSTQDRRRAEKTAGQLFGEARALAAAFGTSGFAPPVLATVPPHHIYGLLFGILAPLAAGRSFVDETPLHPEAVALAIRRTNAGTLVSTPAHLRSLALLDPGEIPTSVHVFSSAGALPQSTADMLHERFGVEVTEVFGSTETGGIAYRTSAGGVLANRFLPLPGVEVEVRDERLWLLDSPFLPPDHALPHPCDDRAEALPDGGFRHLGRLDDVVKVAGKRLSVRELEDALAATAGVEDGAVLVDEAPDGRSVRLRAAVVSSTHTAASLRAALAERFDPTCLPRTVRFVPRLPRAASGKLRRASLARLLDATHPRSRLALIEAEGARFRYRTTVDPELPDFRGHFPDEPVLPGISQVLHLVLPAAYASFPAIGALRHLGRLKFKAKIRPGESIEIRVEDLGGGRVRFALAGPAGVTTAGMAQFHGE